MLPLQKQVFFKLRQSFLNGLQTRHEFSQVIQSLVRLHVLLDCVKKLFEKLHSLFRNTIPRFEALVDVFLQLCVWVFGIVHFRETLIELHLSDLLRVEEDEQVCYLVFAHDVLATLGSFSNVIKNTLDLVLVVSMLFLLLFQEHLLFLVLRDVSALVVAFWIFGGTFVWSSQLSVLLVPLHVFFYVSVWLWLCYNS